MTAENNEMNEEELAEFADQVRNETEVDTAKKFRRTVSKYLATHLPTLSGRATLIVILARFRDALISQEAQDQITKAIKELNHEYFG